MKKRVLGLFLAFALLIITCSFVSSAALETTVVVHGPPFHNYVVRVLDPSTLGILKSVYPQAHYTGISNETFSVDKGKVTFLVIDRYNGETMAIKDDFGDYYTGKTIHLWLEGAMNFTEPEEEVVVTASTDLEANETLETVEEETSTGNETAILTGLVSSVKDKLEMEYLYYLLGVLGGVGVILVIFIVGKRAFKKSVIENDPDSKPSSAEKERRSSIAEKIADAEARILKAQEEINEIKGKEIKRAERKLQMLQRLGNVQQKIDDKAVDEKKDSAGFFS